MELNDIIKPENKVYAEPKLLNRVHMHYCPGCSHGVVHKLVAQVIEEMGVAEKTVGISPVGCAVFAYNYIDVDWEEAPHGRESIHACNRGENIVIIFINNAIYGMTGGQMAPTTLLGQKTATCPYGRRPDLNGYPLAITPLLAQLDGTCYVTRQSVHTAANVRKTKAALKKAFENSINCKGTSVVEIVSACNTGWKLTPEKANKWMEENMFHSREGQQVDGREYVRQVSPGRLEGLERWYSTLKIRRHYD